MSGMPTKPQWGPGPWEQEPDREEFQVLGYRCLLLRNASGSWCGYVALDHPQHPAFGKHYDDVNVSVHGGLTFSGKAIPGAIEFAPDPVFHPAPWVLGFDTAHYGDFSPAIDSAGARKALGLGSERAYYGTYRDVSYVKDELRRLVDQLSAMSAI